MKSRKVQADTECELRWSWMLQQESVLSVWWGGECVHPVWDGALLLEDEI